MGHRGQYSSATVCGKVRRTPRPRPPLSALSPCRTDPGADEDLLAHETNEHTVYNTYGLHKLYHRIYIEYIECHRVILCHLTFLA